MLDWWLCNDNADPGGGRPHADIVTNTIEEQLGKRKYHRVVEIRPGGAQIVKLWKLRLQRPGIYEHLIIVWRHKALLIAIILWKSSGHIYRSRIPSYKTYFHIFYAGFVEAKNVNYNLVIYNYKESLNSSAPVHKVGEVLWRGKVEYALYCSKCSLILIKFSENFSQPFLVL